MERPEAVFWHLFCGTEKVATLSCSLVRFCLFLLEKETEMNEKNKYDESQNFPQKLPMTLKSEKIKNQVKMKVTNII